MATKKLVIVSWDRFHCPEQKGGLGLKNLHLFSKLATSVHLASECIFLFLRQRFVNDVNLPRVLVSFI